MTEPAIDLDAGALEPNALRAARIAFVKWKAERKPGDEGGPLSAALRAYRDALPARATLDAGAMEKALADTPKNDRYPKIQAIRAYLAALHATGTECKHEPFEGRCVHCDVEFKNGLPATGAGEWRPKVRWDDTGQAFIGSLLVAEVYENAPNDWIAASRYGLRGFGVKHFGNQQTARAAVALAAIESLTQED